FFFSSRRRHTRFSRDWSSDVCSSDLLEAAAAARRGDAEARAAKLAELVVTIAANAGDEGKLFGSIGTRDIAEAASKAGVAVDKREVRLPNGVIREVGEYEVDIQVHSDVIQAIKLIVIKE